MKTVLLTDDNEDIIELIKLILKDTGYQLATAADGNQAVAYCLENDPDVVLMDLKMPNLDGIAAIKKLRAEGFTSPIIVLTASDTAGDKKKALAAGADEYIVKTMNMDGVDSALWRYLEADDRTVL